MVVFAGETAYAQVIRLTDPHIPAALNDDFDGAAGYKSFSEDNRYLTRNNGNFWTRRIVFSTESAKWPNVQLTKGGCGPTSYYRPPPTKISEAGNRLCLSRLFGQCNGPNTTVRVRDLLYSKPSAPGVTILESATVKHVKGSPNGTTDSWPRQNSFTPTKKGARLSYLQRDNGAYGPELRDSSNAHVYVLTVFVAGYNVLSMPVPTPDGLPQGHKRTGSESDDSFMEDLQDLNVGTQRAEPSKKRIKTEPVEVTESMAPQQPKKPIREGREDAALEACADAYQEDEENPFEVQYSSTLRMYIYQKTIAKS